MFVQHDDAVTDALQVGSVDFDQFVAWIGFQNVAQCLVVMATRCKAAGSTNGFDFAAYHWNFLGRYVIDVSGIQTDEDVLSDDVASGVTVHNTNEIKVAGAMDG